MSANRGLDDVGVASVTLKQLPMPVPVELRAFYLYYLYYRDGRDEPLIVDNRAAALRAADGRTIEVHTGGGHALAVLDAAGALDLLGWFALQGGDWGRLDHGAWAFALEAGYRLPRLPAAPWLRVGWNRSSGDDDPTDSDHGTFFQVLPTARVYARFPFFNLMTTTTSSRS